MSQAIVVPDTFSGPVSAVFQGMQAGDDLSGGVGGGYGLIKFKGKVWSIQHNGATQVLMRPDGDGPRGSIDVVILKANAILSKTFYENGYVDGSDAPPDCASANGIVPDQGVPKRQSPVCVTCPKNAWGSAPNGGKGKACGDHRRMAVVPMADLRNEHFGGPLLLRCPAASLQDMAAFDDRYKAIGYPYFTMAIKIGFDAAESYPKFTFAAIRPLNDAEGAIVLEMRNSDTVARVINEGTAQAQVAQQGPATFLEAPPAQPMVQAQPVAQQVSPQPVAAAPQPAPVAQPALPPAGAGTTGGQGAGGFGAAAPVSAPAGQPAQVAPAPAQQAAPVVQQPAQTVAAAPATPPQTTRAQVEMTGFGPVTSGVTQLAAPMAQPAVQQGQQQPEGASPAPVAPAVVSAFEGSIDERLAKLIG